MSASGSEPDLCDEAVVSACVANKPSLGLAAMNSPVAALVFGFFLWLSWMGLLRLSNSKNSMEMLQHGTWPGLTAFFEELKSGESVRAIRRGRESVHLVVRHNKSWATVVAMLAVFVSGFALVWTLSAYFLTNPIFVFSILLAVIVLLLGMNFASAVLETGATYGGEFSSSSSSSPAAVWLYGLANSFVGGMVLGVGGLLLYYAFSGPALIGETNVLGDVMVLFLSLYMAFALVTWYGGSQRQAQAPAQQTKILP